MLGYLRPNQVTSVVNIKESVTASLDSPIGMASLQELFGPDKRITSVIDDISPPTDLSRKSGGHNLPQWR